MVTETMEIQADFPASWLLRQWTISPGTVIAIWRRGGSSQVCLVVNGDRAKIEAYAYPVSMLAGRHGGRHSIVAQYDQRLSRDHWKITANGILQ